MSWVELSDETIQKRQGLIGVIEAWEHSESLELVAVYRLSATGISGDSEADEFGTQTPEGTEFFQSLEHAKEAARSYIDSH